MIHKIVIDNFKSLVNFEITLAKFTCLVGLNGAGKSTVLQVIDFLSQLMVGDVDNWLERRHWISADLNSKLTKKSNISFSVEFDIANEKVLWEGSFNRSSLSCTKESITDGYGKKILSVEDGYYTFDAKRHEIMFEYQGSFLSFFKGGQQNKILHDVKELMMNINSLELISPELLRSRARSSDGKLGLGGEKLSAYIDESGVVVKKHLATELKKIYKSLDEVKTKSLASGWKQLEVVEHYDQQKMTTTARHLNDGMLRLMAILVQLELGNAFLLFDEIENGINPELIEYLIDHLVNTSDQVLVTTHSPMILNFMEDHVAKNGVVYLYKNASGHTQSIRLFDIPSMSKKLQFMGPGEAFVDTDLTQLYDEIASMKERSS